ncbi:MAG TPA: sodium-dependent transporter [Deltaproteobacteria bacterium]|nr:sodium-dependent transporter [Deltaproteobacteria bacterium]
MPDTSFIQESRKQWSSEPAFVFSMTAAAVGLGNLWRFPYILGENGGGAFIIAYLIALAVIVFPIMMLEVAAGRLAQGSAVHTYRQVNRFGTIYGWFVVLITTAITSYYLVITGWTLGYAVDAVRGDLRVFSVFSSGYNSFWYFVVVTLAAGAVLIKGVGAIEKLSKILIPFLIGIMIFLVVVASSTQGWDETKAFFFQADLGRLKETKLWAFAFGQAFYTLAIGQGYLVTYGSYIPKKTHVPRACLIVAGTELSVALLAGWMIFPFLFSLGMQPDAGSQLAFSVLPTVFDNLPGGAWLAILFFVLFFIAAFSSSIAGLKVIIAAVAEEFKISDKKAVAGVIFLMLILGTASAMSFTPLQLNISGEPVLDVIDRIAGTQVIIVSGVLGAALFCWFIPPFRVRAALGVKSRWWEWRIYLIGRYLPFILIGWILFTLIF